MSPDPRTAPAPGLAPPAAFTPRQLELLRHANRLAEDAVAQGHHPFAALLVAPDGQTVLLEQGNVDAVNHAEAVLAREAARRWPAAELWRCTLVTTVEPCAMCAGTQYWAHIGRLVYGLAEHELLAITGAHPENPTLDLPCRELFARGQKPLQVVGPLDAAHPAEALLRTELLAPHQAFWRR